MTTVEDTAAVEAETPKKSSKKGLLIGLFLALLLGGGGFFATYSGMFGSDSTGNAEAEMEHPVAALPDVSFVELDPLVISLGPPGKNRHLRFRGSLELVPGYEDEVTKLTPRVLDVLNSYLRAVDIAVLSDPPALIKLRAQMLRRIQLVTGEGRVRDLLILEFVLN